MNDGLRGWLTILGLSSFLIILFSKDSSSKIHNQPFYIQFLIYAIIIFSLISFVGYIINLIVKKRN